jgi:ABC-type multidrug transport system permease subunit
MRHDARVIWALQRRSLNEILRVPGGAIPGVLAPAIFLIGLSGVFGQAAHLRGFPAGVDYKTFLVPLSLLQGASFTGAATGVNLARDIEQGWFDRLLLAPVARPVLLIGIVASASFRVLLPASFLLAVGFALGVRWPGLVAMAIAILLVTGIAAVAACWGSIVALRFGTQQAAPLMQIGGFIAILFTTAYAPQALLTGWLAEVARLNPVTKILEGVRQGFIGSATWGKTWPALVALAGLALFFGVLALRAMQRTGR